MAGLVLATWSLERRRRKVDEIVAKIYKINYKNRYFRIWDYASAEKICVPAETSAVALGRFTRYRISTSTGNSASPRNTNGMRNMNSPTRPSATSTTP